MKNVPVSSSFIHIFSPNSGIKYGPTYYIFSKMRQPRVKDKIATKSSFSKKKKKKKKLSQKPFRCKKIWRKYRIRCKDAHFMTLTRKYFGSTLGQRDINMHDFLAMNPASCWCAYKMSTHRTANAKKGRLKTRRCTMRFTDVTRPSLAFTSNNNNNEKVSNKFT